jgi:hypothetical protein
VLGFACASPGFTNSSMHKSYLQWLCGFIYWAPI